NHKGQDLAFWSHLGLEKTDSIKDVFTAFVNKMSHFHADYKLSLEDMGTTLRLTYRPEFHLQKIELSARAQNLLNNYRQFSFERLAQLFTGKTISIQTRPDAIDKLTVSFEIPAH